MVFFHENLSVHPNNCVYYTLYRICVVNAYQASQNLTSGNGFSCLNSSANKKGGVKLNQQPSLAIHTRLGYLKFLKMDLTQPRILGDAALFQWKNYLRYCLIEMEFSRIPMCLPFN